MNESGSRRQNVHGLIGNYWSIAMQFHGCHIVWINTYLRIPSYIAWQISVNFMNDFVCICIQSAFVIKHFVHTAPFYIHLRTGIYLPKQYIRFLVKFLLTCYFKRCMNALIYLLVREQISWALLQAVSCCFVSCLITDLSHNVYVKNTYILMPYTWHTEFILKNFTWAPYKVCSEKVRLCCLFSWRQSFSCIPLHVYNYIPIYGV